MVGAAHRQHGPRRRVVPRPGSHRRRPGAVVRFHQHPVGDPRGQPGDLPHRPADQLLRRPLRPGHGPADPRRRLRLHRFDHHLADLRQLHLPVLRPRSGDHGAGPGAVLQHPAGPGLCDLLDHHHSAGGLWHHPDQPPADVDAARVAVSAGVALRVRHRQEPRSPIGLDQLRRPRGRTRQLQPAAFRRRLHRGPGPDHADRRAGRLPAFFARENPRQPCALVDGAAAGRPRLDHPRRAEDARRRLPRLSRPAA